MIKAPAAAQSARHALLVGRIYFPVARAPYVSGMYDLLKLRFQINRLLDAMLACGRAFPYKSDTAIEVEVRLERSEYGYVPAVMIHVENASGNAPDVAALKSRVASKAVLLALAMENSGEMTLEGAKVKLHPTAGAIDASLEVETSSKRQNQEVKDIISVWVFSKKRPPSARHT